MKKIIIFSAILGSVLAASVAVFANKTSAKIDAPDTVAKGAEVTIKVTYSHTGNNFMHYTNWASIKANGKEIARWDFSSNKRPEDEVFVREIKYTVKEPVEIEAQGNCNIHGSAGIEKKKIDLK